MECIFYPAHEERPAAVVVHAGKQELMGLRMHYRCKDRHDTLMALCRQIDVKYTDVEGCQVKPDPSGPRAEIWLALKATVDTTPYHRFSRRSTVEPKVRTVEERDLEPTEREILVVRGKRSINLD